MELFDWGDPDWWLATAHGPFPALVLWVLTAVAVAWLRYDATVWSELWAVARRRQTVTGLLASGWWCDRCSGYWVTSPVVAAGPVMWFGVNGGYLLLSATVAFLAPPDPLDVVEVVDIDTGSMVEPDLGGD